MNHSRGILQGRVIAFAGLIGVGKTKFSKRLAKLLNMPVVYEDVDSVMLKHYYADRKAHGFALQVELLTKRLQLQKQVSHSTQGGIMDRSREEDWAFVQMLVEEGSIDPLHAQIYEQLYLEIDKDMRQPDVVVFLKASPETCLQRIHERARGMEVSIDIEFMRRLHKYYEQLIERLLARGVNVISVDWSVFGDIEETAAKIANALENFKGQHIRL